MVQVIQVHIRVAPKDETKEVVIVLRHSTRSYGTRGPHYHSASEYSCSCQEHCVELESVDRANKYETEFKIGYDRPIAAKGHELCVGDRLRECISSRGFARACASL